ncbi:MAG: hypothetical protein AB2693_25300 [Candidatus Thiodiazotropha sp.]
MPTPKDKKRKKRKRQKSKASPNTDATSIKKIKQSDIESESDYFCDAEEGLPNSPPAPCQSDDSEDDFDKSQSQSPVSLNISDAKSETSAKTIMDDTLSPSQAPSQSLLDQPPVSGTAMGTGLSAGITPELTVSGTPVIPPMEQFSQIPHIPCVAQVGQPGAPMTPMTFPSGYLPQIKPVPSAQFSLSDSDVMRIALQCTLLLSNDVDRLIKEKVDLATADLQNTVVMLKDENDKLKKCMNELETKLSTKVDDLEQYSRRSCIRISGIEEVADENTDEIVLQLANRIDVELNPRDIDRSHRVGAPKRSSNADDMETDRQRPREIIVKLKSYQARLALLKGRKALRRNKEGIYINEDLTQKRKNLAFECRKLKKDRKISNTWVYNGSIYIAERDGTKVKVTQNEDLDTYRSLVVPPAGTDPLFRR